MKKTCCILLTIILIIFYVAACSQQTEETDALTADNEILTYTRIDPEKTQLTVARIGNIEIQPLCREFEKRYPDVQVIYLDITGGNSAVKPANEWLAHGCSPDIMISASNFSSSEENIAYFENLSTNPIIENYEAEALQRTAIDGNIYQLPGPSNVNCIRYNKTLFDQYGWQIPVTFDEFVALCNQISADTNGEVEAWNPNAKYSDELQIAIEAFTYAEIFGGADNRAWYNDFIAGNATFSGHMEPYYQTLQTLVDNNILREEHFTYSATTRGKEFAAGKIAMINTSINQSKQEDYEFSFFPFPTTSGELGYINTVYSCFVSVPIKERSEQKQQTIDKFLEFFSSAEGQQIYIGDSMQVSNVKEVPLNTSNDLVNLQASIDAGHMFKLLDFHSELGKCNLLLHNDALALANGSATVEELIAAADVEPYSPAMENALPNVIATATEDMTMLETSFYLADAYREAADAQIGLITHNVAFRGNLMRIFAGDITTDFVTVLKPRSFANDATLQKVSMTGQQLLDALNNPPGYDNNVSDCIYAYSGLVCEVAPWNPLGEKYISVKLSDGSQIDPTHLYTVGVWAGTVGETYITEILESYEGTFEDVLTAKMQANGTVAPAQDDRIKLIWK